MNPTDIRKMVVGDLWTNSTAYENTEYVVDHFGNRFMGTESERKAKDHILGLFRAYGLENPREEPYRYTGWKRGPCKVEMTSPVQREIWAFAHPHSGSTPPGGIEAEVIDLGKGAQQDFEAHAGRIKGKIVLASTGWHPGQSYFLGHRVGKHGWTSDAGGVGLMIRNETPGGLIETGTIATGYRNTGEIPVVGLSFETGALIERQLKKGPVNVRIDMQNEVSPGTLGWNVVGEITGTKHPDRVVLVGAHFDGHDIGQEAASDDLLGAMVVLDVARALARFKGAFKRTMRFVAFGNEECLTVGSTNYVAQHENEIGNLDMMINGDGLGRWPNPFFCVNNPPELVGPLSRLVGEWKIDAAVGVSDTRNPAWCTSTDNHPFTMKGIPTMVISGRGRASALGTAGRGAAVRDHTICDTMDKIDKFVVKQYAILLAELLVALAQRDEPLIRHSSKEEVLDAVRKYGYIDALKAQRRWHPDSTLGIR
ncbi:MAG: M28 family peptidase [Burkholderiales bacterium]|nr:M28 family peptidase [Burkholderiales bacterium]